MLTIRLATIALVILASLGASGESREGAAQILLEEQGSFFVGGESLHTETGNDGQAVSNFNPGTATISQMYVQYQIPTERRYTLPIIMVHGGGHHGKVFETTPDNREGWATYFLRRGFGVYVTDGVNRGRSGYDITAISLARQGAGPATDIPLINRYPRERAWTQFRIGPAYGVPHPGSQFPVEAFDQYVAQLVPAWRDPAETERNVAALVALFDRIGPGILLTWSQSGAFGWLTAIQRPDLVRGIVALEPFGVPPTLPEGGVETLGRIPILLEVGDYDTPRISNLRGFAGTLGERASVLALPELGVLGNGHVVMVERNNLQVADLIIEQLEGMVEGLRQQ